MKTNQTLQICNGGYIGHKPSKAKKIQQPLYPPDYEERKNKTEPKEDEIKNNIQAPLLPAGM